MNSSEDKHFFKLKDKEPGEGEVLEPRGHEGGRELVRGWREGSGEGIGAKGVGVSEREQGLGKLLGAYLPL